MEQGVIDGAHLPYDWGIGAMLVSDAPPWQDAEDPVAMAGGRIVARTGWADAIETVGRSPPADLLLIEASGIADVVLDAVLPFLDAQARRGDMHVIAAFDTAQIDMVAAHLHGRHVQLLCAPNMAERFTAVSIAGGVRLGAHVSEVGRDAEAARLRRLNEEVARIAETLARLTRDDGGVPDRSTPIVGDRRNDYAPPPAAAGVDAHDIRQAIRARRLRGQFFEDSLFEDPAWDMLLDLYAAELERAQVSVSSLCIAAAVAPTTALRWISKMTDLGLFERQPDPFDRRRAFMALSGKAREGLRGYFAATARAGLSIA